MMKAFEDLIEVADTLNGEKGCPWDLEQTFESLRPYVLEEAHEVVEAVDGGNDEDIIEELGDLLYVVVFYAKVAERQRRFSLKNILNTLREKLVRRHPHVFGEASSDMEAIKSNWDRIKKAEKIHRKSPIDGIPKTLPVLMRAQKIFRQIKKSGVKRSIPIPTTREEELACGILDLVAKATQEEVDIESVFRQVLTSLEKDLHPSEL